MRAVLEEKGLGGRVSVDSAGMYGYHIGNAPDERSIITARKAGIEMGRLRARKVSQEDFYDFNLIIGLDQGHMEELRAVAPNDSTAKLALMLDYLEGHEGEDVPDPYYGAQEGFDLTYELIQGACAGLLLQLESEFTY